MKTSNAGVELIARFEGVRLNAYDDGVGVWTIGYGHTGPDVHPGLTITMKQARELLRQDLAGAEAQVNETIERPLNQSQFDALVSLVFNTGPLPLHKTLGSCLNNGDVGGASGEFPKWCKATKNGQLIVLEGLVRRRKAEREMFDAPATVHVLTHWLTQKEKEWVTRLRRARRRGEGQFPRSTCAAGRDAPPAEAHLAPRAADGQRRRRQGLAFSAPDRALPIARGAHQITPVSRADLRAEVREDDRGSAARTVDETWTFTFVRSRSPTVLSGIR